VTDVLRERQTSVISPLGREARSTYKTVIYDQLYELIQNLDLPPGERLVEADLSARFGVSKTPIREALLLLEKEGLVSIVPHIGATVTWLSLHDYEQHLFLQDALEQPALPLVVKRVTPEGIAECGSLLERIHHARGEQDEREYQGLVIQLHAQLFAWVGYPRLTEMIGAVQRSLRRYHPVCIREFEENWDRELFVVTQRFEWIRAGDAEAAAAAVQQGHREMLEFARERVRVGDPRVLTYLLDDERPLQALPSTG
jgi:DNA-binding GntR family transcriptional regulator